VYLDFLQFLKVNFSCIGIVKFNYLAFVYGPVRAVVIATGYGLDDGGVGVRFQVRSRIFLFTSFRPALRPTNLPIQWLPAALSRGVKRQGRELTTHLKLIPRSRKYGTKESLPHTSSRRISLEDK
jgi:hypothetical protein